MKLIHIGLTYTKFDKEHNVQWEPKFHKWLDDLVLDNALYGFSVKYCSQVQNIAQHFPIDYKQQGRHFGGIS